MVISVAPASATNRASHLLSKHVLWRTLPQLMTTIGCCSDKLASIVCTTIRVVVSKQVLTPCTGPPRLQVLEAHTDSPYALAAALAGHPHLHTLKLTCATPTTSVTSSFAAAQATTSTTQAAATWRPAVLCTSPSLRAVHLLGRLPSQLGPGLMQDLAGCARLEELLLGPDGLGAADGCCPGSEAVQSCCKAGAGTRHAAGSGERIMAVAVLGGGSGAQPDGAWRQTVASDSDCRAVFSGLSNNMHVRGAGGISRKAFSALVAGLAGSEGGSSLRRLVLGRVWVHRRQGRSGGDKEMTAQEVERALGSVPALAALHCCEVAAEAAVAGSCVSANALGAGAGCVAAAGRSGRQQLGGG